MIDDQIKEALAAINEAVNPHGFEAKECMDIQLAEESGQVWAVLHPSSERFIFEACYCIPGKVQHFEVPSSRIVFGMMEEEWTDLPSDPVVACKIAKRWQSTPSLEDIIKEETSC